MLHRRIIVPIVAGVLLALLAGCALLPTPGRIVYQRSGGFAGYDDRLEIAPDGSAVLTDRGTTVRFNVPPATLQSLDQAFAAADLGSLPEATMPPGAADMFQYTFEWQGHRFTSTEIPAALEPAAAILGAIVEDHRPPR
jgi:hypothetical protein